MTRFQRIVLLFELQRKQIRGAKLTGGTHYRIKIVPIKWGRMTVEKSFSSYRDSMSYGSFKQLNTAIRRKIIALVVA